MANSRVCMVPPDWRMVGPLGLPIPDPDPDPNPDPDPDPNPEPSGTWPELATVGTTTRRQDLPVYSGNITTSANGQVIQNLCVNGLIRIQHSNVTVRNIYMPFGPGNESNYAIRTEFTGDVGNILIENVEIDGQPLSNGIRSIAMNFPGVNSGGLTIRRAYVHGVGSGPRFYNNDRIEDSIVKADWYAGSASHRSGIGNNGGAHCAVVRSRIECTGPLSSAAISLYGDNALCDDHLFQDNLFVATDGFITYGGSLSSKPYPVGRNIRFINNKYEFRTPYGGPLYGSMSSFSSGNGNVMSGNTWLTAVTLNNGTHFDAGQAI